MSATDATNAINATDGTAAGTAPRGGLRGRQWQRFVRGPDRQLLDELYVPALSAAVCYDRCCAYFSSSVLSAAARGFGKMIERLVLLGPDAPRPAIRLLVNEQLTEDDARALTERGDTTGLEAVLWERFSNPADALMRERLALLGWLVREGLLAVRVGVMRQGRGILHAKFGVVTDTVGDAIVFSGSGNESAQGLFGNYERFEVSGSWADAERHAEFVREFDDLWHNRHPDVQSVSLPEALRLHLVRFAPPEPPMREPMGATTRARTAMLWQFIAEAPYLPDGGATCDATAMVDLWPHQRRVVEEVAAAWPSGRLLCDEVGMGKTVEAILVLRRLMAGRGVGRVLILLPAGLTRQWQAELREKGGLIFPRLEGTNTLVWPDGRSERTADLAAVLQCDTLIMSRETARSEANAGLLLAARPWDLVLLDEAHAARRSKQVEGEYNSATLLLTLLRNLQLRGQARGILLLSATPMQLQPWEPWDLLAVLGEGGRWLADFATVRDFYNAIVAVAQGDASTDINVAAATAAADPRFPALGTSPATRHEIADRLRFAMPSERRQLAAWLRSGSPLTRRMHRNTRQTLQGYFDQGLLDAPPPRREIEDIRYDFSDDAERAAYDAVGAYIERRFEELEHEQRGKGFVMTVYRRRASSSPYALQQSMERRRAALEEIAGSRAYDPLLSINENVDTRDLDDFEDETPPTVSAGLPTSPAAARAELRTVEQLLDTIHHLAGRDTKRERFFDALRRITDDGRPALVFTEYTDTLLYLRDSLHAYYGATLACYSGEGGLINDGTTWRTVTKDTITDALRDGKIRVLLCTDAASEGLNLQAAGALINYDLPWNPSKVEQRIGRIDRIGQRFPEVQVANLFLRNSVDDRVYHVLRQRCGLFTHFVGPMQPVLAQARRILTGQGNGTLDLNAAAISANADQLARETYLESDAVASNIPAPALRREDLLLALTQSDATSGLTAEEIGVGQVRIEGDVVPPITFGATSTALEHDHSVVPLSPFSPAIRQIAESLARVEERFPLVMASHAIGAFRSTVAYWVAPHDIVSIARVEQLRQHLAGWDGQLPDSLRWFQTRTSASAEAKEMATTMAAQAEMRVQEGLRAQHAAARLRLIREVGRYLVCANPSDSDLNHVWYVEMRRSTQTAQRLKRCHVRLGDYVEWNEDILAELLSFENQISDQQRRARLIGKEIDAALNDPRWNALLSS